MHDPTDPNDPPPGLARWAMIILGAIGAMMVFAIIAGLAT